jgi:hypothetical protein
MHRQVQHDLINTVTFYKLNNDIDRRGTICEIHYKDIPNIDLSIHNAANFAHTIIVLLKDYYCYPEDGFLFGEQNDCWVQKDYESVCVRHKYWSDKQIKAFKSIIKTLGTLYDFEVT